MTRGHRAVHRVVWPLLALAVAAGLTLSLVWRPPPEPPDTPQAEAQPK